MGVYPPPLALQVLHAGLHGQNGCSRSVPSLMLSLPGSVSLASRCIQIIYLSHCSLNSLMLTAFTGSKAYSSSCLDVRSVLVLRSALKTG